jgi:hypothetical protein
LSSTLEQKFEFSVQITIFFLAMLTTAMCVVMREKT